MRFAGSGDIDDVVAIREWGTTLLLPLRSHSPSHVPFTTSLRLQRTDLASSAQAVEFVHENGLWRARNSSTSATLKQDGIPTREVLLMPGTELVLAGRTFIAESVRWTAMRRFCYRLLGWGEDRLPVIDRALRAIRLASSGRAALVLSGSGDLTRVAHAIHCRTSSAQAPFVVSDPRRVDTPDTVRGPASCPSGPEAFRRAQGGTLCVVINRLPRDFATVLRAIREPESGVRLVACASGPAMLGIAQIEIPPLAIRRPEMPRIVSEYVADAIDILHTRSDCLNSRDLEWIARNATLAANANIVDIEKAALRVVALRMNAGKLAAAARLLGMNAISLDRWLRRRRW
jgi:hypothetical protein